MIFDAQAGVMHQGYGCITRPASGGTMQGSWSWALFILLSWLSLPNNTPSTSAGTAPPSVPRLYVYKNCIIYGSNVKVRVQHIWRFFSLEHKILVGAWPKKVNFCLSDCCLSRLCLQEESIYLHPSCTPTWQGVGWGQFWWGEAKSWRWCRRTSTSVHTTRWVTAGLILPRGTRCRSSLLCICVFYIRSDKSEFYFTSHWAVCY